jgi:hypothetical protein
VARHAKEAFCLKEEKHMECRNTEDEWKFIFDYEWKFIFDNEKKFSLIDDGSQWVIVCGFVPKTRTKARNRRVVAPCRVKTKSEILEYIREHEVDLSEVARRFLTAFWFDYEEYQADIRKLGKSRALAQFREFVSMADPIDEAFTAPVGWLKAQRLLAEAPENREPEPVWFEKKRSARHC